MHACSQFFSITLGEFSKATKIGLAPSGSHSQELWLTKVWLYAAQCIDILTFFG